MTKFQTILAALLCATALPAAWAQQDAQSTTKAADVIDQKDKAAVTPLAEDDPDNILTNKKLRAESGSKSKLSIASTLQFKGGSISNPFGEHRPNIQAVNGDSGVSDVEGGINVKYNITKLDSVLFGETIRFVTPQSSLTKTPKGYRGEKVDSYDPSLLYQRIYKLGALQSYVQVGPQIYTRTDLTKIGYLGNVSIYNVNALDIGTSGFTVGLETGLTYSWFRNPQAYPGMSVDDTRDASSDYNPFAYPYLEYKINDTFNIRTVGLWFSIEHTLLHEGDYKVWTKDHALQSVGLGISLTRDIFLYPNLQFSPDKDFSLKRTNVALATDINLF